METSCKNLVKENNDWKADSNSNSGGQQMHCCGAVDKGDMTMEEDRQNENEPLLITEMPDSIFLYILSYLPFSSIGNVAQVCQRWWQICADELLWREVFLRHYKLPLDTKLSVKANSWRSEFKRLYYHTPCFLSEERKEHRDEVLHISFSHDGTMFATCSKDGFFKVWECGQPCRLLFEKDMMSSFSWKFTQFSQFNETDTCLLVSGVYFGCLSTSGEIAVFNLQDGFNMQCRVTNKPYDVFGTWYDNDHLLSGTLLWTGDFNSVSAVWLSKASQEVESEMESVSMVLYRFENRNSSSIRLLHVAEVERDDEDNSELERSGMDHSPSPLKLPLSLEQGERTQAFSSQALQTIDDASANRDGALAGKRADVAVGDDEAFPGCEMSLLDKLLKKSIAENEFDLENEDDTDIEEDTGGGDDDSGMARGSGRKGNDNSSNSSPFTDHSHDGGISMTSHGLVDTARGCDCENECQDQEEEDFGEGGSGRKSIAGDSMVNSVGVNVNFISFGEPHQHTTSVNNCFNSDKKQSAKEHSADHVWTDSLPSGHSSQYNKSQNLKDLMGEKRDSGGLEWSVRNAFDSGSSSSSSSCCSSNSSSEGGGGENNCNNSGSNSSRGLSGGFVSCGVYNNSMETTCQQSCDCDGDDDDDSLMEDDECVSHPQCMPEPALPSALPTTVSGGTLLSLQGSDDDNVCTEGGRVVKREENVSPFQGSGSIEDNLLLKTQITDGVKGSRAGISSSSDTYTDQASTSRDSFHHTPLSHNKNDTSDACASDNSCDTDCTSKRLSLPDSNSKATVADNESSSFRNDSAVKNDLTTVIGPGGTEGVEEEGLLLEEGSFSHCDNSNSKAMDNAATQTEESSVASLSSSLHSSMAHMSHSSSLSRDAVPKRVTDKLLIYTWGSETYIPHKIGIKRIKRSDFCKGEVKARQSSMLLPDVMENLHNMSGETRRDWPDVSIDMHGHIVGLSLSPDDRHLYVNCRAWPKNYFISDPQESPPLAQEVEISTIDLKTFQFVGPVLRSHKAYTHSDECFFLNLDVSNDYVVSGAEDRKGYIWDRHYGICLGQFEHRNVVNCMAACPSDPEIAISVSDDHTFKVWMSRRKLKEMEDKMGSPSTTSPSSLLTHQNSLVQEEDSH